MAVTTSAGLLLFRRGSSGTQVFLVHPGGPFWAKKEDGAWSVPKGLIGPGEDELDCAHREFQEETGFTIATRGGEYDLGTVSQSGGKRVHLWAIEGDCDPAGLISNLFEMEWPPRSGRTARFPEVDRGRWFDQQEALRKITKGQLPLIKKFYNELSVVAPSPPER